MESESNTILTLNIQNNSNICQKDKIRDFFFKPDAGGLNLNASAESRRVSRFQTKQWFFFLLLQSSEYFTMIWWRQYNSSTLRTGLCFTARKPPLIITRECV